MDNKSFKTRVREEAIEYAKDYSDIFLNKEYLIFSNSFKIQPYYLLKAYKGNYLHLIGVHTTLNPEEFFNRCFDGSLTEDDFDFLFQGENEQKVKGTVRRKIKAAAHIKDFYKEIVSVEEKFQKGKIICKLAGSDGKITIGFTKNDISVPMTLLYGNELNNTAVKCDLVLSKDINCEEYKDILIGNNDVLSSFLEKNKEIVFIK